jgi:hypothetical protein
MQLYRLVITDISKKDSASIFVVILDYLKMQVARSSKIPQNNYKSINSLFFMDLSFFK